MKYAYTVKDGKINNKFALENLDTINKESYDSIVEVASDLELRAVEVADLRSEDEKEQEAVARLISQEKDEVAIESLVSKGKIEKKDGKYKTKKQV